MRSATALIRSGSATDDPPNFCTTKLTAAMVLGSIPATLPVFPASLDSAPVSKVNKRERQRINREARREYLEALTRRRRRLRMLRNVTILAVVVVGIGAGLAILNDSGTSSGIECRQVSTPAAKQVALSAPAMTIDTTQRYSAAVRTTCGTIEIALDAQTYPTNVNNFVSLATQKVYDNLAVVRVAKDFVLQTGSPDQTQAGGVGYTVQGTVPSGATGANLYPVGTVAMAKSGADPAGAMGSQYFIVTGTKGNALSGDYAVVGTVTKGLAIAKKIATFLPPNGDGVPSAHVNVEKVTITTKPKAAPSTTPSS
jgi:cyclophilin family peptidyl-prolyl cis-trans isomerase